MDGESVETRFKAVQKKIQEACARASRNPEEVKLLAVSKKQKDFKIEQMAELGQKDFGENYVQELLGRFEHFKNLNWHYIGGLQRNKCKFIVGKVTLIHSVDRPELAQEISKVATQQNVVQDILLQINLGDEDSKNGASPESAEALARDLKKLPGVRLRGLMALPPLNEDPENTRTYFRDLKKISKFISDKCELSMGTSHDFEVAIEEGATLVRVGTSLFGER